MTDLIPRISSGSAELAPAMDSLIAIAILAAVAITANFIVRKIILRLAAKALPDTAPDLARVAGFLANIVPAVIVARGVWLVPHRPPALADFVANVAAISIILSIALALSALLTVVNQLYDRRPDAANRPIKGYVQVVKILIFAGAAILVIATLMDQSPLLLLSGLGALAAVLMLVFKDTILSLVASVQLSSNDMLRVGDWIEMPQLSADGDVIDIALHTVKVQNWDKTITTIPTHRLIEESFKNWRGMQESGGRRIKRSLAIDQTSIRFLEQDEWSALRRFSLIHDYLDRKQNEIDEWNISVSKAGHDPVNARRATNIGTFRAYAFAYLRAHERVAQDMTLIVRQLQPTHQGLPLEIYCFTNTVAWVAYEGIQSDIFDHLIAILPEFGLRLFQEPSGADVQRMIAA